jgi:hypothetical protein
MSLIVFFGVGSTVPVLHIPIYSSFLNSRIKMNMIWQRSFLLSRPSVAWTEMHPSSGFYEKGIQMNSLISLLGLASLILQT